MKRTIRIRTALGYVSGFNSRRERVNFTLDAARAKKFASTTAVNRWLDEHVNNGYGLSWGDGIKLETWTFN